MAQLSLLEHIKMMVLLKIVDMFVFKNNSGSWEQVGSDIDGEKKNDYLGNSVAYLEMVLLLLLAHINMMVAAQVVDLSGFIKITQDLGSNWEMIFME